MNRRGAMRALALTPVMLCAWASPALGSTQLSIRVAGNQFVDGSGQPVRLLGVNRSSTEYACTYGYVASGPEEPSGEDPSGTDPLDGEDAAAIAAWHATAVRIPLNEDCWLGENGEPADGLTASAYRQAIESYAGDLEADGIYPILDLHWTNPGDLVSHGEPADGQHAMPDAHSLDFWASVATAFKGDPAVVFDAFNEPYSPAANGDSAHPVDWSCWKEGGCTVPDADDQEPVNLAQTYKAVGMQQVVDAIRATGASQPILLGGLSYANDLSGWLADEPTDPDEQLAASFHNYSGESCASESCWNATIAPVAARVPVVSGEFGEDDCPPSGEDPDNFDNAYMDWADRHGVGYLGWGWFVLPAPQPCSALYLIVDYAGDPAGPNGVALRDRLAALAGPAAPGGPEAPAAVGGSAPAGPAAGSSLLPTAPRPRPWKHRRHCRARRRAPHGAGPLSRSRLNRGGARRVCSGVHRGSRPRHHHR
jgi:endoglucanase